jgi:hypothetical protein
MWAGWLDAKLVELPLRRAANPVTRRRFADQWSESNPRFRAAHAVASYLEREGVAPLSAGGGRSTPTSGRFWRRNATTGRRASLSTWCQVAPVGDVRFRPGNSARPRRLEPDGTHADASRPRHAGDGRPRGVLRVPARRRPVEADRALGRRLPRRRPPRVHARVRRLAQDAGGTCDLLAHRTLRPNCLVPSPRPIPSSPHPSSRDEQRS